MTQETRTIRKDKINVMKLKTMETKNVNQSSVENS